MRKTLFVILAVLAVTGAIISTPPAEADVCAWQCGPCGGYYCPCQQCIGGKPLCQCWF